MPDRASGAVGCGSDGRSPQDLPRHGSRSGKDLPDAAGWPRRGRGGTRRRRRLPRDPRPGGDGGAARGPGGGPAAHSPAPGDRAGGDGSARDPGAGPRAVPDRRARAHQRPRRRASEALRGRRRGACQRQRRLLDRERAAPGEPQRPGDGADRRPGPRDSPRRGAGRSRRGRPHRPHSGGSARAAARGQGLPRPQGRRSLGRILQGREPAGAARGGAAPGGGGGRGKAPGQGHPRRPRGAAVRLRAGADRRTAARPCRPAPFRGARRAESLALLAEARRRARHPRRARPRGPGVGAEPRAPGKPATACVRARGGADRRRGRRRRRGCGAGRRAARDHLRADGAARARGAASVASASRWLCACCGPCRRSTYESSPTGQVATSPPARSEGRSGRRG